MYVLCTHSPHKLFPSISLQFFKKLTPLTIVAKQQRRQQHQQQQHRRLRSRRQLQSKGARVDRQTAATHRCRRRLQRLHHQVQVGRAVVIILI